MTETKENEEKMRIVADSLKKEWIELRKRLLDKGKTIQDFIYEAVKKELAN